MEMKKKQNESLEKLRTDGSLNEYMVFSKYNVLLLHSLGFLPYVPSTWHWHSLLQWLPHLVNFCIFLTIAGECMRVVYCLMYLKEEGSLSELVDVATAATSGCLALYKMCVLIYKRALVEHFLHEFALKWDEAWRNTANQPTMVRGAKLSRIITLTYSFMIYLTVSNYLSWPLLRKAYNKLFNAKRNDFGRPLPFPTWYPWEHHESPYYELTYFMECIGGFFIAQIISGFETTYSMFVIQVCIQFRVLQRRLSRLNEDGHESECEYAEGEENGVVIRDRASLYPHDKIYLEIRECVKRHNLLLGYVKDLEVLFSTVIFMELVGGSIILTLVTLQVLVLSGNDYIKAMRFIAYMTAFLLQILIYCLFGTLLTEESERIVSAAWSSSLWSDGIQDHHRKALLLLMMRTRRPCYLTAAKFFNASLIQFTKIVSSAGSYFAIFRNFIE